MQRFVANPMSAWNSLCKHRDLIVESVIRDVQSRYKGSVFGGLWTFIHPIFMLIIYTFVFTVIFKARWRVESESKSEFALILFAGMLVFNLFSECLLKSTSVITANPNYVKKVLYPLEILPFIIMGSALFQFAVGFIIWLFAYVLLFGLPPITTPLIVIVLLPFVLLTLGISWILASLGVYARDINQLIGVFITALMFLSPIFYPVSAFPDSYKWVFHINPLTSVIESSRSVLYWNRLPEPHTLLLGYVFGATVFALGFWWFQRTRKGFADVI